VSGRSLVNPINVRLGKVRLVLVRIGTADMKIIKTNIGVLLSFIGVLLSGNGILFLNNFNNI
jgi:hypothetical protein